MLNRSSKSRNIRGAIYLSDTVLALSVFTQSGIAHEEYFSRQDVLNVCNQISWRIIANNKIVEAKEGSWITDEYYSESIRNVIGKAIADCLTEKNEFAGKKAEDVITFDVDAKTYTAENWNAVVLWNLIHVYNCGFKNNGNYTIDEAFKKVEENVKNKYSKQIEDFDKILEKAMCDIREYAKELDLGKKFHDFCDTKNWIGNERFKEATRQEIQSIQITPNLSFYESGYIKLDTKSWLIGYTEKIKKEKLEFEGCYYKGQYIRLKMDGIFYDIKFPKMIMKSMNSTDQIEVKINYYETGLTSVFICQDNYTPEQKNMETVCNYIVNAKKPDDVESIYYDKKDGWKVKYKE